MDTPDKFTNLLGTLPFMLYIKGKGSTVNKIRLIEVLLSSALTIGIIYGIMTTEARVMREQLQEIRQDLKELRRDFYEPKHIKVPR